MKQNAFARAIAMMRIISSEGVTAALMKMGPYVSRGHGQNKYSGRGHGNYGTPWMQKLKGHTNGKRECARRMRQLEAGIIHLN